MLSSIFEAFVKESPISVMMRGVMEATFRPQPLDEIGELFIWSKSGQGQGFG